MENVLKYYEFSTFKKDESGTFNGNEISFSVLNETHFLIFEKESEAYHLYVTKYNSKQEIGVKTPLITEILVRNYDKSNANHRRAIKQYLF